ncbi:hypothetical protein ELY21_13800 [Legionella sp. km535]|uniref:hypothetical protein n=1 Tax=Legionella sp. km535 TaxID=2498107 RepID=UPI000F8F35FC|nr:hypothetical protein [Legionella sp. km535]RUR16034.1 hypothetical protein ELY21_13800 [Legionella sp. km535]
MKSRTEKHSLVQLNNEHILSSDVNYVGAVDSYINHGKKVGTAVIRSDKRQDFFARHPHVHQLLQREQTNPLLEEGKYWDERARDRLGEYYLTYEALTLLIEA